MSKAKKLRFDVISPDGFSIQREGTFATPEAAQTALTEWVKRYEGQGYYSTADRTRLSLEELPNHCTIIPVL